MTKPCNMISTEGFCNRCGRYRGDTGSLESLCKYECFLTLLGRSPTILEDLEPLSALDTPKDT